MFASFEITSQGLTRTDPKPKLIRSDEGCLPCRQKRKKCDSVKPICGRCRNSYRRDTCTWPANKQKLATRSRAPTTSTEPNVPGDLARSSAGSSSAGTCAIALRLPKCLGETSQFELPEAVRKVSPDLSFNGVLQLSFDFQGNTLCHTFNYEQPILLLCYPTAKTKPALLHAWIACSSASLPFTSSYWQQKAILHQNYALKHLREDLEAETDHGDFEEWMKGTILMLHIFEAIGPPGTRPALSTLHLNAAHQIFKRSLRKSLPSTVHGLLLLEAYILRTAANSLFEKSISTPLDYVAGLIKAFRTTANSLQLTITWRTAPWIGPIGLDIVDYVYRLGWLAHRLPLQGDHLEQALSIARSAASPYREPANESQELVPWNVGAVGRIFRCACAVLAVDFCTPSSVEALLPSVEGFAEEGIDTMDKLSKDESVNAGMAWPLAILGCAVRSKESLYHCQSIGARLQGAAGPQVVAKMSSWMNGCYELKRASGGELSAKTLIDYILSSSAFV